MPCSSDSKSYDFFRSLMPVFIGGMPRSGTSLVQSLLNGHPELLVYEFEDCLIREFIYPSKTHAGIADTQQGMLKKDAEQVYSSLMRSSKCSLPLLPKINYRGRSFDTGVDADYFKQCFIETLSSVVQRWNICEILMVWMFSYFRSLGIDDLSSYKAWVTKCPDRGRCIQIYHGFFPDCRIIQMVRDPRAFYASYALASIGHASGLKPVAELPAFQSLPKRIRQLRYLVNEYKVSCSNIRTAQRNNRIKLKTIRYEDLVSHPEDTMKGVSGFLGISFHSILVQPTFRNRPWPANSSFVSGEESEGRLFSGSLDYWKKKVLWYEKILMNLELLDELITYGYIRNIQFMKFTECIRRFFRRPPKDDS